MWRNVPKEVDLRVVVNGVQVVVNGIPLIILAGFGRAIRRPNNPSYLFNSTTTLVNDEDVPFTAGIGTWKRKVPKQASGFSRASGYQDPAYFMDGVGDMDGVGNMDY